MRKLMAFVLFLSLLCAPMSAKEASSDTIEAAHKTTHRIMEKVDGQGAGCSATAVGPHALLTASHCELLTTEIEIDDQKFNILGVMRDGNDHTIYAVDAAFSDWSKPEDSVPYLGEDIFYIGNPGDIPDVLRKGYIAKIESDEDGQLFLIYDSNGFYGDSGSAIFDEHGKIIGVVSFGLIQVRGSVSIKLMGSLGLNFTKGQWKEAQKFNPKKK